MLVFLVIVTSVSMNELGEGVCGGQGTTFRALCLPPAMWVPGTKLRLSGNRRLSPLSRLCGPR